MVESITYLAVCTLFVVGLGVLDIRLEHHFTSAVYRLSTTFAKFLFVVISRSSRTPLRATPPNPILLGTRSTCGSK